MLLQEIRERVHQLVDGCDSEILLVVKVMLENNNHSHELAAENIVPYNAAIENAEAAYQNGEFLKHDDVIKLSLQWKEK